MTVKYICLSDLHFGEEDSLLTNLVSGEDKVDPAAPSPVLNSLIACLRTVVEQFCDHAAKPTLILNGDILELALARDEEAGMVFQRFLEGTMASGAELFSKIFFLPGNHDHHLWEMAREAQYVGFLGRNINQFTNNPLPRPWHATNMFVEDKVNPVRLALLDAYASTARVPATPDIQIAYPNLGLLNSGGDKCVIFHHGHFTEDVYGLMSKLNRMFFKENKEPFHVWDLERENFAWIDFLWSALGRSDVGLETIYEKISDTDGGAEVIDRLAFLLAEEIGWSWTDVAEKAILKKLLGWAYHKYGLSEKLNTDEKLSEKATKSLYKYVENQLWRQMADNLVCRALGVDELPKNKTFEQHTWNVKTPETVLVYGHTHKPFSCYKKFNNYPGVVDVYNTGGWVVETKKPSPLHGGAMVLVDEDLNVAAIRLYNEEEPGETIKPPYVEEAPRDFRPPNPLYRRLKPWLNPNAAPWSELTDLIGSSSRMRRAFLEKRIMKRLPQD
ncbi:MAG: metallophosphoesterase [Pseudomonadota bacterium]